MESGFLLRERESMAALPLLCIWRRVYVQTSDICLSFIQFCLQIHTSPICEGVAGRVAGESMFQKGQLAA